MSARLGGKKNVAPLTCPMCEAQLRRHDGALACSAGHSFDIAKEGYVNLLPPQHRIRGVDGDVPSMLQARRRFLDAGHYEPLLEALVRDVRAALIGRIADDRDTARTAWVAETGCGEGYYIGGIAERLSGLESPELGLLGSDLSKSAVKLAAKRYPAVAFFVADVHRRIYLKNGCLRVLLDVFSPRNADEFARVLEPGGRAVIVIPTGDHLASLRESLGLLYIPGDKEQRVLEQFSPAFVLENRGQLRYPLELGQDAVRDLVQMGPNHWHAGERALVGDEDGHRTEAAFTLLRLRRR